MKPAEVGPEHVLNAASLSVLYEPFCLLTPSGNLDVPFGAGACTLGVYRFIWCGESRSAVKASTRNPPPPMC
jgi:hypothetical protein